ncbi:U-box domain-containing protein 35-like isoform X1 [Quercus robur]|uniref:U-box domain-containing protein 35-like isoform X1 n=1 Tax=Quercus robur TaxID=38942 RepID=UPI002161F8D4|nr:U-box domain-containing protein 35-like isoform X1 [Quercus robur]XP_050254424.1 U-box domain-containing protein 35-like isoform X1 [Quercus robur]XP_050254425.1 U-box domain-containing protein 35-like isoform X1 [Quercus robur]XP_050254426.1 U-box domain-containing protein 35-like isoform X1 [Quercus robur]XP_050254427.1 U-box domain-containing protein 35-like isoform X1 [Quercus robur]XP_050254429.1 U-box domain-containing protein 35-like isoform X1 [Quercus robur]XP_050254430.1 U-box do
MATVMEKSVKEEADNLASLPSLSSVVAVAVNGKKKSKYVVKWALEKCVPEGKVIFKLIHVRERITGVPTQMGNSIPLSQVREDVAAAYIKEINFQTSQMLLPYKKLCAQKKVEVDDIVIESDDVEKAIAEEVAKHDIHKLVIGASSRGLFTRKLKGLSSKISASTPRFCTVYVVSRGKLSSVRPSNTEMNGSFKDDSSETSCSSQSLSSHTSSSLTDYASVASHSHFCSPSLPMQRFQALSTINHNLLKTGTNSVETNHSRCQSLDVEERKDDMSSYPNKADSEPALNWAYSCKTLPTDDQSWISDQASNLDALTDYPSSDTQEIDFELEKLRIELRHVRGMYAIAQSETIGASRKLHNLSERRMEEAMKLKEINIKEERAKELARQEKERHEAAKREAEYVRECAEREASQRREAEMKAIHDSKEKKKFENALVGPVQQYHKFTWEEIVSATSSFSEDLKIGMGAYGSVYKCNLHHTTAAVKVLHSEDSHKNKQFLQELDILSKIRHPHLLLLLGACQDRGCLVYEHMENGSLEDRLLKKNGSPPIPWFERCRIAWEVASALVFLHNSKPRAIIHRDLKPANILLDHNLVSKIGDVGLSTMLKSDVSSMYTVCSYAGPVGTLCYIDPEYQRTGILSPQSDVYAFGMVILQLLTAKPAIALAHVVETALSDGKLLEILDQEGGNWPIEVAKELAEMGLSCAELRRQDRPDLKEKVLPALERLKEVADRARDSACRVPSAPPNHFICPILKDVMDDPCVAADGYTYDRRAIKQWLEENDTSPMTNMPLPHKNLIPNYTLLSAVVEWKSGIQ